MKVIVLGCGRVGALLATQFSKEGHDVSIIDKTTNSFKRLGSDFSGQVILGIGIDEDIQRKAGIEKADVFIAVTNGDNTNAMAAQVAKFVFNVPKVIMRVYDPERALAYREMGLETICSTTVMAELVTRQIMGGGN